MHLLASCVFGTSYKPGHFQVFSNFLVSDWAPGPVQMCRDRRDIAGHALKVGFGRVFAEKVDFLSKFRFPSATYPFFGPLIHEEPVQDRSHEIRSVYFLLYKVVKPDFCLPITSKS